MKVKSLWQLLPGQPPLELVRGKVVHNRVQATVQTGQAQGDRVQLEDGHLHAAGGHCVRHRQEVEGEADVVRSKAHQENNGAREHHLEGLALLAAVLQHIVLLAQAHGCLPGAGEDHHEREHEAHQFGQGHHGHSCRHIDLHHWELCEALVEGGGVV